MVKIGNNVLLWVLVLFAYPAWAGSLVGEMDKNTGSTYDEFVYTLTASGSDLEGEPQFPQVSGMTVRQAGTSQNYSIVNGVASREVQYQYILTTNAPGTYKIPEVKMQVDGQMLSTLPLAIEVSKAAPAVANDNPEIKIERVFDKATAYVGEPILRTVKIFSRVNMVQPRAHQDIPDMFKKIPIDGERNYRQVRGQYQYNVHEIASVIIPQRAGSFDIDPFRLTVLVPDPNARRTRRDPFGGFFGGGVRRVQKNVVSEAHKIVVKPLPAKGRPIDFSGLVGEFEANSSLSHQTLKTGETSTLTIVVQGRGTVEGMRSPIVSFPDSLKIYDDKPVTQSNADRRQGLVSRRTYKYAIVPTKVGDIALGNGKIWVFNTKSERFEALKVDLGVLKVGQGDLGVETSDSKSKATRKEMVKTLGEDIVGLHRGRSDDSISGITTKDLILGAGAQGVGFLFAFSGFLFRQLQTSRDERSKKRRISKAHGDFKKAIASARKEADIAKSLAIAGDGFRTYLGNKFLKESRSLTTSDIVFELEALNIPADIIQQGKAAFSALDMLQYGGSSALGDSHANHLEAMESLAVEVEKKC